MADAQTKVAAIRAGFAVSILLLLTGCAATPIEKPKSFIRPVKTDINQVVAAASAAVSAQPIQSRGTLRFQEFKAGKAGHPENLNIQLRFTPPYHLYLKADSILGEAIRLGSNPEQFYLCFKPNEISSYFHGKWALANGCNSQLFISPQVILEALGNASVDNSMKLSTENNFYVLSKMDASGILLKKVYLDPQSYFTRRIEYFDINGDTAMEMTLNNYTSGDSAGIVVPTSMEISYFDGSDLASIVKIKLKGVKPFTPTEAQLKGKFNPPSTKGFKNVYELAGNCQFIKK